MKPGWRGGSPLSSFPSSLVDVFEMFDGVAGPAEQFAFVDGGLPPVCPMLQMMDIAVSGFGPTSGTLTVPVAGDDRPALRRTPDPGFPADVEDFSSGTEDDPGERTVTSGHSKGVDVDDRPVLCFVETTGDTL